VTSQPLALAAPPRHRLAVAGARSSRWLLSNKLVAAALAVWLVTIVAAAFPGLLVHGDPNAQDLLKRLEKPGSSGHLLGTDELGGDILTRLVHGARVSVVVGLGARVSVGVGLGAVLIAATIGTAIGLLSGYFRRGGRAFSILIDIQMAFPSLLLVLATVVMLGRSNVWILALVLGVTGWAGYARVLRGLVIGLREREFVVAARASGSGALRIMGLHLLPNIAGTLGVLAVLDLCRAILAEASVSFVGLGIQPPTVSWGLMLSSGKDYIYNAWWLVTLPGLAIALVVTAANVIANALQSRVDPLRRTLRRL
jgi:peptide/nickel transport system permease protein